MTSEHSLSPKAPVWMVHTVYEMGCVGIPTISSLFQRVHWKVRNQAATQITTGWVRGHL